MIFSFAVSVTGLVLIGYLLTRLVALPRKARRNDP